MPNWTYNRISFNCSKDEFKNLISNYTDITGKCFTFQNVIPRPSCLAGVSANGLPSQIEGISYYMSAINPNNSFVDDHFAKVSNEEYTALKNDIIPTIKEKASSSMFASRCKFNDCLVTLRTDVHFGKPYYQYARECFTALHETGYMDWYEWNNANWGTKWDACDSDINYENCVVTFDTAWSTPYPIFYELAKQNPNISFNVDYDDEDCTSGRLEYKNGECTLYESWERISDDEE